DIGFCRIAAEGAVASGIRRIEALTGEAALEDTRREQRLLGEVASALRTSPSELPGRVDGLLEERRRLEREAAELRRRLAAGGDAAVSPVRQLGSITFAARALEGVPPRELRGTVDTLRQEIGSGVVALVAVNDGKAAVVVSVSDDLTSRLDAVDLVRK